MFRLLINIIFFRSFDSFIVVSSIGTIYVVSNLLRAFLGDEPGSQLSLSQLIDAHDIQYGWMLKLLVNCFGYSCVFVPLILVYQYTQRVKYLERCGEFFFNTFYIKSTID